MIASLSGLSALVLAAPAGIPPVSAEIVVISGEPTPGSNGIPVGGVNNPFTDGQGRIGFTGTYNDGGSVTFVWYDGQIIWRNTDAMSNVLVGGEATMGVGDNGEFIYSPSVDGDDAVWGHDGLVLKETDLAPGFPGEFISFTSRPQMVDDGTAFIVAGRTFTQGGSSQNRVLYRHLNGVFTKVVATGDLVLGFPVQPTAGVDFDYWPSSNGQHVINVLDLDTGSTANDIVVTVDLSVIAREGEPTGDGDNWQAFDNVSINNDGTAIFTGDTDGPTTADEFIAVNGAIAVREGMVLDGVALASPSSLLSVSINDLGHVAHAWSTPNGDVLFVGQASDLAGTSARIVGDGDLLDANGDAVADWVVLDINASAVIGPGLDLAEDGRVVLSLDLDPVDAPGFTEEAIVAFATGFGASCPADLDASGDVGFGDLLMLLSAWGPCSPAGPCPADLDGSGDVGFSDLLLLLSAWGPC